MKLRELEKLYHTSKAYNDMNDILIDSSLRKIEEHKNDEAIVTKEVEMLKKSLENRKSFNVVERDFVERKAWREGYTVAFVCALLGVAIGEFVPFNKIFGKL